MTDPSNIIKQLRADEGCKPCVYNDHLGFATIGVGRLVDSRKAGAGLRQAEIEFMLANDIEDRMRALSAALPWFISLDEVRQGVLVNMAFQMGTAGLLAFSNTLKLIRQGQYDAAADAMMQSKWAVQTPERAARLSKQLRIGQWVFA